MPEALRMQPQYAYTTVYKQRYSQELYGSKLCLTKEEAELQRDKIYPDMEKFCLAKVELLMEEDREGGRND